VDQTKKGGSEVETTSQERELRDLREQIRAIEALPLDARPRELWSRLSREEALRVAHEFARRMNASEPAPDA
jgi:hypothetical protein